MSASERVRFFQSLASGEPKPGVGTPGYKSDPLAYSLSHVPMRTPRPITVICAGAGFSGLSLANEVETRQIKNCTLKIYEKNSNLGGTWFENRYPGCACDIPIHNYQFSWAPYPYFPSFYAESKYILEYLEELADQRNLRKYVKTSHKVIGAKWVEEKKKWQIRLVRTDGRELVVSDGQNHDGEVGEPFIEECDIFINATGAYNNWRWPTIPNRTVFQGDMYHSASWPQNPNLKGRTVALIGNGSSGIQILPAILEEVEKIYVFIRNRTWITAGLAQRYAGPNGSNKFFTEEEIQAWAEDPDAYLSYRKDIEHELNARFRLYIDQSDTQKAAKNFSIKQMTERLANKPELVSQLIPEFPVGCRRPTPGNGYLEALCSPKVEIVWGEIETFTEKGLKPVNGELREVDTIICATGFNMGFVPRFPIVGTNGADLREEWTRRPPACYLSLAAENMPNYFVYMGPTSPLGHGSIVGSIESVTDYIRKFIYKLQTENYAKFTLKHHYAEAWQSHALKWVEKTVWNAPCVSTFKNGTKDGKIVSLHPGSRLHYFDLLDNPRFEDYDWESLCSDKDNLFAWLADGFTVHEMNGENDLS
ncbi:cyclohexanone monooxygenase [Xylogone sp. PMI_703]|nr:cyclohexanone monooxygenase [Xylogone sp. PMI_703]